MNSSIHAVFEPLFSLGNRARQAAITPDHIAIGMGGHFESFGAGRSHEFENLSDDHSGAHALEVAKKETLRITLFIVIWVIV